MPSSTATCAAAKGGGTGAKATGGSDDASDCLAGGVAVAVPLSTVLCAAGKGSSVAPRLVEGRGRDIPGALLPGAVHDGAVDERPARHLVRGRHHPGGQPEGTVYVGRKSTHGLARFGNRVAYVDKPLRSRRPPCERRRVEQERCVIEYARWIIKDEQAGLRSEIRALRGKKLACHCMGFPCHAEIIAILTNEPADAMGALCRACEEGGGD